MNTILLGFACVLLGLATILATPVGRPSERQERSLKTSEEVKVRAWFYLLVFFKITIKLS